MTMTPEGRELILNLASIARKRLTENGLPRRGDPTPEQMKRFVNRTYEREWIHQADDNGQVWPPYTLLHAEGEARQHLRTWQEDIRNAEELLATERRGN